MYSTEWSSTWIASRRTPRRWGTPFGTAHEPATPSCSRRKSQWRFVAWCSWTTKRGTAAVCASAARRPDRQRPLLSLRPCAPTASSRGRAGDDAQLPRTAQRLHGVRGQPDVELLACAGQELEGTTEPGNGQDLPGPPVAPDEAQKPETASQWIRGLACLVHAQESGGGRPARTRDDRGRASAGRRRRESGFGCLPAED